MPSWGESDLFIALEVSRGGGGMVLGESDGVISARDPGIHTDPRTTQRGLVTQNRFERTPRFHAPATLTGHPVSPYFNKPSGNPERHSSAAPETPSIPTPEVGLW